MQIFKCFQKPATVAETFQPLSEGHQSVGPLARGVQRNANGTQPLPRAQSASAATDTVASTPRSFVTTASEAAQPVSAPALARALSAPQGTTAHRVIRGQLPSRSALVADLAARVPHQKVKTE